jgi:arabinan endo-1,5-alpha-L-arabinosidase
MQQSDLGIIDATYFRDNYKNYLIYKTDGNAVGQPTEFYAVELSADGRKVISGRVFLLKDTLPFEAGIIEAPWIIYANKFYYLFYSSCGYANKCYSVSVARSKQLLGGYEKYNQTILSTKNP